jgi:hypothetical protein
MCVCDSFVPLLSQKHLPQDHLKQISGMCVCVSFVPLLSQNHLPQDHLKRISDCVCVSALYPFSQSTIFPTDHLKRISGLCVSALYPFSQRTIFPKITSSEVATLCECVCVSFVPLFSENHLPQSQTWYGATTSSHHSHLSWLGFAMPCCQVMNIYPFPSCDKTPSGDK